MLSLYGETAFTGAFVDVSSGDGAEDGVSGLVMLDGQDVTNDVAPVPASR